ncbi:hypothetical protein PT277_06910 [Acetobacteraceae bacterium ESL0709]|nr:hypothetical protein [Acetobacteraceae bacterium ESL0697]MDF7678422.1 hypothetical protein [Acetobacteraceae bacterium ESL0709]
MPEDTQFTEQSLREALERLGSRSDRSPSHKSGGEVSGRQPYAGNPFMSGPSVKRRRFVNDGSVVVEHRNDLGRHSRKAVLSAKTVADRSDNSGSEEVAQLQQVLTQEKQRTLAAESEVERLKIKLRALETRLAHYQLQLEEREKKLTLLKDDNVRLKMMRDKRAISANEEAARRARVRRLTLPLSESGEEQEPVKWWSGD